METLRDALKNLTIHLKNSPAPPASILSAKHVERPVMCSTCRDTEMVSTKIDGLWFAEPCPDCAVQRATERLQAFSNMTSEERRANLDQIVCESGTDTARMVEAAKAFIDNPVGILTIYGKCGNAKTVALQAIVNALLARNIPAIYLPFYDVLSYVKEAFKPDAIDTAWNRLGKLQRTNVLCIDEIDKVKQTEWVAELQTELFDLRYRRGLSDECGTVLAMNGDVEDLEPHLKSRVMDGRNVVIRNMDRDMRPLMSR